MLVTTEWLAEHLNDPNIRIIESDEDVLLYDTGHIPGAQKVDWHADLNDPLVRDYMSRGAVRGAAASQRASTTRRPSIFYGDKNNWWATYAFWVFQLFGFTNAQLLDGGRMKWEQEGRPMTTDVPQFRAHAATTARERHDEQIRAFMHDVRRHLDGSGKLVDVRSPDEYTGKKLHMPDYPQEGAMRGGHIPGARERSVGARGERRRHVQVRRRAARDLREGAGTAAERRRHRLLPHRRALVAHLVRADATCSATTGAQLRRQLDGVGQCGARADRAMTVTRPRRSRSITKSRAVVARRASIRCRSGRTHSAGRRRLEDGAGTRRDAPERDRDVLGRGRARHDRQAAHTG